MSFSKINYSIIIPHKNIPVLLRRCLDSIPKRDDIQIIIVDDNSDPSLVNFSNFPGVAETNTEVYFTKENKGAGYARNVGLTKAKGKWLVFADADDFFNESFKTSMNIYTSSDADLILFTTNSVVSETLLPVKSRGSLYNEWLERSKKSGTILQQVRYNFNSPCSKFVSRELVLKYNITFEETFTGNDVLFSTQTGHFADKIIIDLTSIYCATIREGSLDTQYTYEHIKSRLNVALSQYSFLLSVGKTKYRSQIWSYISQIKELNKSTWFKDTLIPTFKVMRIWDFIVEILKLIYFSSKHRV